MNYSIVPAHEGENLKWRVIFKGRTVIETTVQDYAEDITYMMNAVRNERISRMTKKEKMAIER